jgi:hypothetical protein
MTSGMQGWQKQHCAAICRQLIEPIECIAGETTIENYLWIIWDAKAVLTVDGSASHIAAAFKRRCLTLFRHTNAVCLHREQTIPGQFSPETPLVLNLRDYSSSLMRRLLKLSFSYGTVANFYPLLVDRHISQRDLLLICFSFLACVNWAGERSDTDDCGCNYDLGSDKGLTSIVVR